MAEIKETRQIDEEEKTPLQEEEDSEDAEELERLYGMGKNQNKGVAVVLPGSDSEEEEAPKITKSLVSDDERRKNLERLEKIKREREMAAR